MPNDPAMAPDVLTVRMYRGILGDCFLLMFGDGEKPRRHILIDCGALQNVPAGPELMHRLSPEVRKSLDTEKLQGISASSDRIKDVVKDIVETTNSHIDLLVITHEHFDHLCGFREIHENYPDLSIGELWLAWTEDPNDKQACDLQQRFTHVRQALAKVAEINTDSGTAVDVRLSNVKALSAFLGPHQDSDPKSDIWSTRRMIKVMQDRVDPDKISYLSPGRVLARKDDLGFTIYVLGPPREQQFLDKSNPSLGSVKEVYLTNSDEAKAVQTAICAHFRSLKSEREDSEEIMTGAGDDEQPFARPHLKGRARTGGETPRARLASRYLNDPEQQYRRIDHEWAGTAESLALKMDSDTNNTSLALAFELPDGRILLFPGDAQVGNWLSWRNQTYPPTAEKGDPTPRTIDDLLRHVVFYKVAHHGSHNATLKELGLEKMTDTKRLTAAIPVVETIAAVQGMGRHTLGKGWAMPYANLFKGLEEKTNGRIVRGDGDIDAEKNAFNSASTIPPVTIDHHKNGLWVELNFTIPAPAKGPN